MAKREKTEAEVDLQDLKMELKTFDRDAREARKDILADIKKVSKVIEKEAAQRAKK